MSPHHLWQNRLSRRDALAVAGSGMLAVYLGACGDSNGDEQAAASEARPVDITQGFGYSGKPGTMNQFFRQLRDTTSDGSAGFTLRNINEVDFQGLKPRLLASHQAKRGPELETWYQGFNTYEFFAQGVLEPLDDYVGGDEETSNWLFSSTVEGKRYLCPLFAESVCLVGHGENLRKAGIEVSDRFESFEAFVDALETLKGQSLIPLVVGGQDGFGVERWILSASAAHMNSIAEWPDFWLGRKSIDEPVISGWIDQYVALRDAGLINDDAGKLTDAQALQRLGKGQAGFMLAQPSNIRDSRGLGAVGLWKGSGALSSRSIVAGSGLMMTSYSDEKESAGRFLEYIHQPEQLRVFNELTGDIPADSRFDPDGLDEFSRGVWDLFETEPKPQWWEEHVTGTQIGIFFELGPVLAGGASAADIKRQLAERVESARTRNSAETRLFTEYREQLEA